MLYFSSLYRWTSSFAKGRSRVCGISHYHIYSTYLTNETCHHVHNLNLIYNFPQSLLLLGHMQLHLMLTLTHGQTIWPQQLVAAWSSTAPLKSLLPVTSTFPLFQPFHCFNHHSWPDKTSRNTWKTMQIPTVTCGVVKPISFLVW